MNNHFVKTPGRDIPRSKHDLSNQVNFTCNVGDLIPVETWSVYPGDIFEITPNIFSRLQTLLAPLMDDISVDLDFFFVPYRLVWNDFQAFMGENTESKYYPTKDVFVPQITGKPTAKSVADYIGVPINNKDVSFESLIPRAYSLIWNEWYRDEQLQDPILIDKSSNNHAFDSNNPVYGGKLLKACKYHDYFTSAVPSPQAGTPVDIPFADYLPVRALDNTGAETGTSGIPVKFRTVTDGSFITENSVLGLYSNGSLRTFNSTGTTPTATQVYPSNLFADATQAINPTINDLRLAFATQQFLEINSFGTRYTEIIRNHFGVLSPDARLQRPELIGHFHDMLNITQVVQQSETGSTPLGDTAGMSATYMPGEKITKAFTEHGVILAMITFRYKHSYQQGISKELTRKSKFDFYFPVFANLGYQPIYNKEIFVQGTSADDEVFAYQERWSELRHKVNRVAGEIRSSYSTPLDYWSLQDNYSSQPFFSDDWIKEDSAPVNRAIAVSDKISDQLIVNIFFNTSAIRPLPVYSIPGLNRL